MRERQGAVGSRLEVSAEQCAVGHGKPLEGLAWLRRERLCLEGRRALDRLGASAGGEHSEDVAIADGELLDLRREIDRLGERKRRSDGGSLTAGDGTDAAGILGERCARRREPGQAADAGDQHDAGESSGCVTAPRANEHAHNSRAFRRLA